MSTHACTRCGTPLAFDPPIARDAECPHCGLDVRCCLQCRHHDASYNNQCRETEADPVADKDRRNFCEFFELRAARSVGPAIRPGAGRAAVSREAAARAKLDALFGGKPAAPDRASDARKKLESLFGPKPAKDDDDG